MQFVHNFELIIIYLRYRIKVDVGIALRGTVECVKSGRRKRDDECVVSDDSDVNNFFFKKSGKNSQSVSNQSNVADQHSICEIFRI